MKKLLGLLGAAGLVATTSATVVACGDKEGTKTDLSKMELTVASGLTEKEAKESIAKQITAKVKDAKETTDYTITVKAETRAEEGETEETEKPLTDGTKITVAATKESTLLSGSKTIEVGAKAAEKVSLDALDIKITADMTLEDAKEAISAAIVKMSKEAVETTDYTISHEPKDGSDDTALTAEDKIQVKAVDTSNLLTGSKEIIIAAAE
ncbi:lipoprotein [Spiroplasma endosymbiont of Cantharis lateralis]|uniref:lipoprotein n=1 Tax=Spiroplasma endosymbiont of Cantharis lateralis TaxID=3066277 RepID=UPI00313ACA8E